MKAIRILVVDDESVVRDGVVTILSFQPDMKVVGEAENGIKAVEIARQTKPDVVLLDMVMPKQNGLESIPKIKSVSPESRILVLTSFAESDRVYQSIKAGALGFLLKDATRVQLLQAIRDVAKGLASIQPSIAMKVINEIDHPAELMYTASPLTPRELETLKLIARGLSNQEIAAALVVHDRTVAKYVSSILDKLHLANRTQAALYAINEGLAEQKK
ncbi:MAG: response regulator transcription factor [Chloroflexi bacterium]|nr:response regulator transcription factor [Chloroflexota bacterium]